MNYIATNEAPPIKVTFSHGTEYSVTHPPETKISDVLDSVVLMLGALWHPDTVKEAICEMAGEFHLEKDERDSDG